MNLFELFVKITAKDNASENIKKVTETSEVLTNKIAVMSERYSSAQKKVEELTKKFNESVKTTGVASEETQKLADELSKAEKETASAEKELSKYTKEAIGAAEETEDITEEVEDYAEETEKATEKTSKFSEKLSKGLKTAAKIGAAAVGAAATGIVALTKNAVSNYAEYEQLVGGVDTLFKDSSNKVQQYAANAYKTAGISANQYMETVTGFSASLLASLENDTEAAAKYADMAITDMADNANKMGTDMELIENAYQGFAKQNYTMLDNLKLGYGGTKSEMERLIKDANKLKVANGEMADLTIDSYADIVEAIHLIQDEMDITETTAQEAGTTIQGSIGSMQAAWQDLLTGLADGNADIETLVNNLITTIVGDGTETNLGVLGNIMPAVRTVFSGIGTLIGELAPVITEEVPALVTEILPSLLEAASETVLTLITAIPSFVADNLPVIAEAAQMLITELARLIMSDESAEQLGESVNTLITEIIPGLLSVLGEMWSILQPAIEVAVDLFSGIVEIFGAILSNEDVVQLIADAALAYLGYQGAVLLARDAQLLLNTAIDLCPIAIAITAIAGIILILSDWESAIKDVDEAQQDLNEATQTFIDANISYNDAVKENEKAAAELAEIQQSVGVTGLELAKSVDSGTLSYKDMTDGQREVYDSYLKLKQTQETLREAEERQTEAKQAETEAYWESELAIAEQTHSYDELKESIIKAYEDGQISAEQASEILGKAFGDMGTMTQTTFVEDIPEDIRNGMAKAALHAYNSMELIVRGARGNWEDIKQTYEDSGISEWFAGAGEDIAGFFSGAWSSIKEDFSPIWEDIKQDYTDAGVGEWFSGIGEDAKEFFTDPWDSISEDFGEIWEDIKGAFDFEDAKTWGSDMIENFVSGVTSAWRSLKQTVSGVAQTVKNFLGFSEPEEGPLSDFHTYAPDMIDLFIKGIRDNERKLTNQIEKTFDFGDKITDFEYGTDDYPTNNPRHGGVSVVQNIYSQAKTAADLMQEALYQQERAVILGV